jgi:hypothetical protein
MKVSAEVGLVKLGKSWGFGEIIGIDFNWLTIV